MSRKIDIVSNDCVLGIYENGILLDIVEDDLEDILDVLDIEVKWHDYWELNADSYPRYIKDLEHDAESGCETEDN